jgi:hypothetical protein
VESERVNTKENRKGRRNTYICSNYLIKPKRGLVIVYRYSMTVHGKHATVVHGRSVVLRSRVLEQVISLAIILHREIYIHVCHDIHVKHAISCNVDKKLEKKKKNYTE